MSNLPEPLTPADCDLRDFKFMPLDVVRLRDSDIATVSEGDEFRCAVLLWCAAWHQVPAASLPDDDKVLAQYAGFGRVVKEWMRVRNGALRGWVKCSDGRLYHPVVAEKANESWLAKLRQRLKTECSRIKKHNERHGTKIPFPEFEDWLAAGCPTGQALHVPSDNGNVSPRQTQIVPSDNDVVSTGQALHVPGENPSKGQGEGQGQGEYIKPNHLSGTTSTKPEKTDTGGKRGDERPDPKRNVAIAVLLRNSGVKPFSFAHPMAIEWADNPKVTDELLTAAVQQARDYKPTGDISPNYLKPIIDQLLNPPEPKAKEPVDAWWSSNEGIDRKGRELGVHPGRLNYPEYKAKIFEEIRKRQGGQAA